MRIHQRTSNSGQLGTWGETFGTSRPRAGASASAIAVPLERLWDAYELLLDVHREVRPGLIFALRFVQGSLGHLAFTRYDRTCVIELDGVDSRRTREFLSAAWGALEASDIPHTHHWGKINRMTPATLQRSYGDVVARWRSARDLLLPADVRRTFANAYTDAAGLTSP
ncbi:MAG: hypothetical protein AAGA68_15690 [Pseudomonadota bacterium]